MSGTSQTNRTFTGSDCLNFKELKEAHLNGAGMIFFIAFFKGIAF